MDIFQKGQQFFFDVYKRFPIDVEKGRGVYLYDKNGKCYLDFLAGIAVNALGYNHPAVLKAIEKQLNRNLHLSNYFLQDIQVQLAEKLLDLTPFSKIFFTNSGTEAIEGILKLLKKWGRQNNKNEFIAFEGSFHGRSLGALSITIQEKYQQQFLPLLPNIKIVPFDDVEALEEAFSEKTLAVFYEGITGEGGIRPISPAVYEALNLGREKFGFKLIADEIQTGVGRTGSFYYYEQSGVIPDAIATAKGLGGGLPLGAFLTSEELSDVFKRGDHGTTYGGNPLACAAGLAVVELVSREDFLLAVQQKGQYLLGLLSELKEEFPDIALEVRGRGLMAGIEVKRDALKIMTRAFEQGLIFNIAGGNTLRFVPPLIVEKSEIDEAYEKLRQTFIQVFIR